METNSPTGVTTYYLKLKDEYNKMGHHVLLITPECCPRFIRFFLKALRKISLLINSDYIKLFISEFNYFTAIYFAVKKIRDTSDWNIIHGQDPNSSCAAKLALKGKVPVVTTCHYNDTPVSELELTHKLIQQQKCRLIKWYKYLFSKSDYFIFLSRYQYDKSTYLLKPNVNMRFIQNGINFNKKGNLMPANNSFIISNVGTLEDRKNQILLIKAGIFLKENKLPFKIWLFGNGPQKKEWENTVKEAGLTDHVIFWGHRKNVIEIIKKSHLYVHTSKNESSCGMCILEAYSIGLPVLALANGAMAEYFPTSGIGLLAPDFNPSQLADEITNYLDEEKRKQLRDEQYEYSSSQLNLNKWISQTMDYYNYILSKN